MSDAYYVQHNTTAMFAQRQSLMNNTQMGQALERLSSGYRINRASDDSAGIAVSEKLRTQVRGFNQAAKNIQDGISFLQTGESALQSVHDILQRMRELLVQSANGIYSDTDRSLIQLEITQLKNEIDRIHTSTTFNSKRVFDFSAADIVWIVDNSGSMAGPQAQIQAAAPSFFQELAANGVDARVATVGYSNAANTLVVGNFTTSSTQFGTDVVNVGTAGSGTENVMAGLEFGLDNLTYRDNARKIFVVLTDEDADDGGALLSGVPGVDSLASTTATMNANEAIVFAVTSTVFDGPGGLVGPADDIELDPNNPNNIATATGGEIIQDLTGSFASIIAGKVRDAIGEQIIIHSGANKDQRFGSILNTPINNGQIGTVNVSASTQTSANSSIAMVDSAVNKLSRIRATIGAEMNRLDKTLSYTNTVSIAIQSSESRIRDADMAKEITEFTKSQVLVQSANAMLAQANLIPQNILSLLG